MARPTLSAVVLVGYMAAIATVGDEYLRFVSNIKTQTLGVHDTSLKLAIEGVAAHFHDETTMKKHCYSIMGNVVTSQTVINTVYTIVITITVLIYEVMVSQEA